MLRLLMNGRPAECAEGATILDALRIGGVQVPTLCHDNRLTPYGGCRLCIVQVAGFARGARVDRNARSVRRTAPWAGVCAVPVANGSATPAGAALSADVTKVAVTMSYSRRG